MFVSVLGEGNERDDEYISVCFFNIFVVDTFVYFQAQFRMHSTVSYATEEAQRNPEHCICAQFVH